MMMIVSLASAQAVSAAPEMGSGLAGWFQQQATVPNILLVCTFLVHLGMYRQDFKQLRADVTALQQDAHRFVPRDLLQAEMHAVNEKIDGVAKLGTEMMVRVNQLVGHFLPGAPR